MSATATTVSTTIPHGTWASDPVHSSANFAVKHMVVATFRGRFEHVEATLVADEQGARLSGAVRADSVAVKDDTLTGHLLSPDFFDAEQHPLITFEAAELRREGDALAVTGELTLKGVTRPVEARGTITDPTVTFDDLEKIGLTLETTIDRTAYGLSWNAPLPKGGFALADDVVLTVELELARAEA